MEYIHAFWVGGLICALVQILLDSDKTYAGQSHGPAGLFRCGLGLPWDL